MLHEFFYKRVLNICIVFRCQLQHGSGLSVDGRIAGLGPCSQWSFRLFVTHSGVCSVQNGLLVFLVMKVREVEEISESVEIRSFVECLEDEQHGHKTKEEVEGHRHFVQLTEPLVVLLPGDVVSKSNCAKRDKTKVKCI